MRVVLLVEARSLLCAYWMKGWRVVRIGSNWLRSSLNVQPHTATMTSLRCVLYSSFDTFTSDLLTQTNSTSDPGLDLPSLSANHYLLQGTRGHREQANSCMVHPPPSYFLLIPSMCRASRLKPKKITCSSGNVPSRPMSASSLLFNPSLFPNPQESQIRLTRVEALISICPCPPITPSKHLL